MNNPQYPQNSQNDTTGVSSNLNAGGDQSERKNPSRPSDHTDLLTTWPLLSPLQSTSDTEEWRQLLHDQVIGEPPPQSYSSESCECFQVALKTIEQLHRCQRNLEGCAVDYLLNVTRNATTACDSFCQCEQCSRQASMLLYIAVLQQAAICYDFLSASLSRAEHHSLQLRLGSFETHIEMDRDIYGMVLSMEIKRAIKVVIRLYDTLQLGGAENVLEEVKYQQELVETLRGDLEQLLNRTT